MDPKPLALLKAFWVKHHLHRGLNLLHLLPFFPWDADRGFSVVDYRRVHPDYGSWEDIASLAEHAFLMFDFVLNHASIQNIMVQSALIERHLKPDDPRYPGVAPYKDFVIAFSDAGKPAPDALRNLSRPRPTPVLTPYAVFENSDGSLFAGLGSPERIDPEGRLNRIGAGWVWTTFSRPRNPDGTEATRQVDLNFKNPAVLLEAVKILLEYARKGASLVRLDAAGYIWKDVGIASLHEPQAHGIIQLLRDSIKSVFPVVRLVAEVNEPQEKLFPYLGRAEEPECDLVYQFAHFPLAVYGVLTGDGRPYMNWLKSLAAFQGRQFVTVLGSHDGMGLKPVQGWLSPDQIDRLLDILIRHHGALPNYAVLPGGKQIVYEVCATPWNLINNSKGKEPISLCISRCMAVVALGFLVRGVPAFYINGLVGAENAPAGFLDENRSINRQPFDAKWLSCQLEGGSIRMKTLFQRILHLLEKRRLQPELDPAAPAAEPVFLNNPSVVAARLKSTSKRSELWACINVSKDFQAVRIQPEKTRGSGFYWKDLLGKNTIRTDAQKEFDLLLSPYQVVWLKPSRKPR